MKLFDIPAIVYARRCYHKWKSSVRFDDDLKEYLENGIVISRQDIFVMAKVIDVAEEGQPEKPGWFVRIAVGDLRKLVKEFPAYLEEIRFCRRQDPRLRKYSVSRLLELVNRMETAQHGRI